MEYRFTMNYAIWIEFYMTKMHEKTGRDRFCMIQYIKTNERKVLYDTKNKNT